MPRRIALIVGVSQYDKSRTGLDSLSAPVNDAQAVYEVLHQYGGFDALYPLPLGTEGVDASGFVPSHELADRLRELLTPQAGDEVELAVIYFSGHGVSDRGQVVYLSASDERLAVALPWLADLAKNSAVKNVCLWLDCCHSGEVLKFADLGDKGFCVVAASAAGGEALALNGRSLLTDLLCKALTPRADCQEIQVKHFINELEQQRHNLPQQVLCRWSDATPFTLTQLNGEVAVESSSPRKPTRGWVWHSTDASIAAGQISVLSVLETFCALGLYGWLAFHFEHQWWLLISAVAAPIILLRSPESKARGLRLLHSYWNQSNKPWNDDSLMDKFFFKIFAVMPVLVSGLLSFSLTIIWQRGDDGWTFWLYLILLLLICLVPFISELTFLVTGGASTIINEGKFSIVWAFLLPFSGKINDSEKKHLQTINLIVLTQLLIPFVALAIWLRGLLIRIISTLRHPVDGLRNVSTNWRENLLVLDLKHLPELLPGSAQIDSQLSILGLLDSIQSAKDNQVLVRVIFIVCWYIPAVMWRWSLKATLWLWFPLALLLRPPFEGKSLGEVRDIATIRINGLGKWLPLLAVVVMLWLSSGYFSPEDIQSWAELGGDTISKLLDKLLTIAPPPPGLRYWALWLVCGLSIIMWWLSDRLQIMHKKVLEEEDALDGLTKERRNLFLQRAHRLERWHTARVVSFILLGYSFALYLANEWYPLELGRFIPAWLIDCL